MTREEQQHEDQDQRVLDPDQQLPHRANEFHGITSSLAAQLAERGALPAKPFRPAAARLRRRRPWMRSRRTNAGRPAPWRKRASGDAGARLAADPRQPDAAGDPRHRHPPDGAAWRSAAGGDDAGAQPRLRLQRAPARPAARVVADDGVGARANGRTRCATSAARSAPGCGCWLIAMPPYWLTLWNLAPIMRAFGQSTELAEAGQSFMRAYMWCTAPWLLFQLLRNFVAALERPRLVMWLSLAAIGLNALLGWALIFGHFGLPALGIVGGGPRQHADLADRLRGVDLRGPPRPAVPALSPVRPLVALRLRADAGDGPAGLADRAVAVAGSRRVRARRLSDGLDRDRRRSPPMPSRCRSRR